MASMTESEIGSLVVVSLEQKNKAIERLENSLASALELVAIRDRKIELQAKEIELLKKLLALQKSPDVDIVDLDSPYKPCI
jgi:hypothetical protein